jgi:hypothetical protein
MMDTPYGLEHPADAGEPSGATEPDAPAPHAPAHYKQSATKRGATPVMASVMRGRAVQRWARAPGPPRP